MDKRERQTQGVNCAEMQLCPKNVTPPPTHTHISTVFVI